LNVLPILEYLQRDIEEEEKTLKRLRRKRFIPVDDSESLRPHGWKEEWERGRKERAEKYMETFRINKGEKEKEENAQGGANTSPSPLPSQINSGDRKIDRFKGAFKFTSKGFSPHSLYLIFFC
jgi:hypothetical protein